MRRSTLIVFLPLLAAIVAGLGNRALGNVPAKVLTTGALFAVVRAVAGRSSSASWAATREAHVVPVLHWVAVGRPGVRLGAARRCADRGHAGGDHHRLGARPPLQLGLHGRGPGPAAVLRLSIAVHLRDADAGDGGQPRPDVLRLGRRRPRQLPADRLLVPASPAPTPRRSRRSWSTASATSASCSASSAPSWCSAPSRSPRSSPPRRAWRASTIGFLGMRFDTMTMLCLLLFIGAMGKSAQLGLHTWLPDAMEGPTPVSALIHAATMVTAGVFMVCRLSPMFETAPVALARRHLHRRRDLPLRRDGRHDAVGHQAGDRLFDLLAARLHVLRRGRRRLWRGDVPPVHPRLLQGAAVPRRGLGDPRDAPRAGHALSMAACGSRSRSPSGR